MKGSVLLASSAVFISQFASTIFATPIESHLSPDVPVKAPLVARQKGTYTSDDALNATLAGTINCYRGGTWILQSALEISNPRMCGEPVHDVPEFTPFSLKPNADLAYPSQTSDYQMEGNCMDIGLNCEAAPHDKVYVHYTAGILAATHANLEDCEYALERLTTVCHGKNGYTRGGWYTFNDDGTNYGLDPTRNGGNQ